MTEPRLFTRKEIESRNQRGNATIIIDNVVYDVSGFLEDHPGGVEVLLDNAGKDATKCFRDVGHSDDAYTWREQYVMGEVVESERWPVEPRVTQLSSSREPMSLRGLLEVALPPIGLAVVSSLLYIYLFGYLRARAPRQCPSARASYNMPEHKQYTRADVETENQPDATLFIIHNQVYNVTAFLDQHPGGHEVLVGVGGSDASEDFDDIGHSVDAKEIMKKYLVGEIVEGERVEKKKRNVKWEDVQHDGGSGWISAWRLPLLVALFAAFLYFYLA